MEVVVNSLQAVRPDGTVLCHWQAVEPVLLPQPAWLWGEELREIQPPYEFQRRTDRYDVGEWKTVAWVTHGGITWVNTNKEAKDG